MREAPDPKLDVPYAEAVAERNAEAWHHMDRFLAHGPALVGLANRAPHVPQNTAPAPRPDSQRRSALATGRARPALPPAPNSASTVRRTR
jgi:hypothetical protein